MKNRKLITFLTIYFTLSLSLNAAVPMSPDNLRTCDKKHPVGTEASVYFGWMVNDADDNEIQTGFQLLVASSPELLVQDKADMWNSGKVTSSQQNYIYYQGKAFQPASKYFWKVRTWDKDGNEGKYSAHAQFETGLFTNTDWSDAKWIKRDNDEADDYTFYRKSFTLSNKEIKNAVIYLSVNHDYDLYLNENLIDKGQVYHYPQFQYYNAYNITNALKPGKQNLFALFVHWYGGGQGRPKNAKGLLAKTLIEYTDGSKETIVSDASWKNKRAEEWVKDQPRRNGEGIGYIEKIDAGKIFHDWNSVKFDDASWTNSTEIGNHPVDPWTEPLQANLTRLLENEIKPASVNYLDHNSFIIDLGKVYSGIPSITFEGGNAGDEIKIQGGFTLNEDGSVSDFTTQDCNMEYYFILDGNKAVFKPAVYLGMRYIQVFNSPNKLSIENVSFTVRHYEMDMNQSGFSSSNDMLNKVWDLMKRSIVIGSQESFVDTPTREKGGFLGDAWSQGVPAMTTMYDRVMNLRILYEFLDSQDQYWPDGRLNAVYPNGDGKRDIPDYTQQYLIWVWDYYQQTGNLEFLKENYEKLRKVAEYQVAYLNDTTGLIHNLAGGRGPYEFGIIDWPPQMRYDYDVETVSRTVVDAYAFEGFNIISNIAAILGFKEDNNLYAEKALKIKNAMNSKLINKQGVYIDGIKKDHSQSSHASQHANMLPLVYGMVPENNLPAVKQLLKDLKMSVGMVTVRWLPQALGMANEGQHLLQLYTNTEWDGWAKTIAMGGTATWESWDANTNKMSQSHPWGVAGLLGMQEYILGLKVLKPQHERIQIKPLDFGNELTFVKGSLPTDRGSISIAWERNEKQYTLYTTIPDNVTANVYIPLCGKTGSGIMMNGKKIKPTLNDGYCVIENVGSGNHMFENIFSQ